MDANRTRLHPLALACALFIVAAVLPACQPDLDERTTAARAELDADRYDAAIASVDATLAKAGADAPVAKVWGLEKIRLEALARAGRAEDAAAQIERLASRFAAQVTPELYLTTARQVREATGPVGALELLSKGDARFPDDPDLDAAIEDIKNEGAGDDQLENRLESLGYL